MRNGLRAYLRALGSVDEFILAGDILDTNVSTFTDAMFGPRDAKTGKLLYGLQSWLRHLFKDGTFAAKRIVYLPGNHDYAVWDQLCTFWHYLPHVAAGRRPDPATLPKCEGSFDDSYLCGLLPNGYVGGLRVKFPDHAFTVSGRRVLVTHGHYLDAKQTMGKNIRKMIESQAYRADPDQARRRFFQYAAAYQTTAHAVSYTRWMRVTTDDIHKFVGGLADAVVGALRDEPLSASQLTAVEEYLRYYRQLTPDVFVFGHTHEAGHCRTSDLGRKPEKRLLRKVIDVWNTGCFLDRGERAVGSFVLADDRPPDGDPIQLVQLDRAGNVL